VETQEADFLKPDQVPEKRPEFSEQVTKSATVVSSSGNSSGTFFYQKQKFLIAYFKHTIMNKRLAEASLEELVAAVESRKKKPKILSQSGNCTMDSLIDDILVPLQKVNDNICCTGVYTHAGDTSLWIRLNADIDDLNNAGILAMASDIKFEKKLYNVLM
jgi:hypothetical protein